MSSVAKIKEVNDAFSAPAKQIEKSLSLALRSMRRDINRVLSAYFPDYGVMMPAWGDFLQDIPAVDIIENGKTFKVVADLPGLDVKDIDVHTGEGLLTLTGQRHESKEEETDTYHHRETVGGYFERAIPLPASADCNKAEATLKNGLLIVSLPKKAGAEHASRKIPIKKAA